MDTKNQEILRDIRKEFFAFRNGIIADKLRKANDPHPVIMGCLLTDIVTITRGMKDSIADDDRLVTLAEELWSDTNSRECRLADGSDELVRLLISDAKPLVKYTGYRLLLNLLLLDKMQPTAQLQLIISNEAQQAHGALAALLQDLLEEFQ